MMFNLSSYIEVFGVQVEPQPSVLFPAVNKAVQPWCQFTFFDLPYNDISCLVPFWCHLWGWLSHASWDRELGLNLVQLLCSIRLPLPKQRTLSLEDYSYFEAKGHAPEPVYPKCSEGNRLFPRPRFFSLIENTLASFRFSRISSGVRTTWCSIWILHWSLWRSGGASTFRSACSGKQGCWTIMSVHFFRSSL